MSVSMRKPIEDKANLQETTEKFISPCLSDFCKVLEWQIKQ